MSSPASASIVKNAVVVTRFNADRDMLAVSVPEGWDDVKKLVHKVLSYEGRTFVFTGWNSDTNEAFFRASNQFATIS